MHRDWRPSIYRTNDAQTAAPTSEILLTSLQEIGRYNAQLQQEPYEAQHWCERAAYYLALNYPELAAGDAFKAISLLKNSTDYINDTHFSARAAAAAIDNLDLLSKAYNILGQALFDAHCHWEAEDTWQEAAEATGESRYYDKARQIRQLLRRKAKAAEGIEGTPQEQVDRLKDGGVYTVDYPWVPDYQVARLPDVVEMINEELKRNTTPPACYVNSSSLISDTQHDMLGMFAARDTRQGECILVDRTATGICSSPQPKSCENCCSPLNGSARQSSCCEVLYCSSECQILAMTSYHKPLCGKDLQWLIEMASGCQHNASPLRPLLMLRCLATCIHAGVDRSPLDHPLIARLQPLANRDHLDVFTLKDSIVTPIKILQQLGVDVYANQNFDTFVLHTIWTRLANNKAGAVDARLGYVDVIAPFLPLFNHSCDPNIEWRRDFSSTTVKFFALKDIPKNEELFSCYLALDSIPVTERIERLWPWFEGPCRCARCANELKNIE